MNHAQHSLERRLGQTWTFISSIANAFVTFAIFALQSKIIVQWKSSRLLMRAKEREVVREQCYHCLEQFCSFANKSSNFVASFCYELFAFWANAKLNIFVVSNGITNGFKNHSNWIESKINRRKRQRNFPFSHFIREFFCFCNYCWQNQATNVHAAVKHNGNVSK